MKVIFDREKLYNDVWENSIHKVALQYQISDNDLKTVCNELNIPLPTKSYWGKFYYGNVKPSKVKLPKSDVNTLTFDLKKKIDKKENKNEYYKAFLTQINNEKEIEKYISICSSVSSVDNKKQHPIINTIKKHHKQKIKLIQSKYYNGNKTEVSKEVQDRIYNIMNVICNTLNKCGFSIDIIDNYYTNVITFMKDNIIIYLRIREKNKRISVKDDSYLSWNGTIQELIPNGNLEIIINDENQFDSYFNKTWSDGKKVKIEDKLIEIILFIINYCEELKFRKKQDEIKAREIEEQRKINERKRQIQIQEREKLKLLEDNADQYERACKIRNYIENYSKKVNLSDDDLQYIQWAKEKADCIDPLIEKIDVILDEKIPYY